MVKNDHTSPQQLQKNTAARFKLYALVTCQESKGGGTLKNVTVVPKGGGALKNVTAVPKGVSNAWRDTRGTEKIRLARHWRSWRPHNS